MSRKQVGKISYDLHPILGRGSFAIVYRGSLLLSHHSSESNVNNDKTLKVAVKRLQYIQGEVDAILREIKVMEEVSDHPNILRYIRTEENDDFVFIVTELCGGTLEDYVKGINYEGPRFKDEKEILWQATQGLAHLHRKGIVHRDIKPTNILIFVRDQGSETEEAQIKLADFGLSKILSVDTDDCTNTSLTNPSGTKGWMAPEVYIDKRFDTKVDIFALGLVFGYTLSEGNKHPFGDNPEDRVVQIRDKKPMKMVRNELKKPYSDDDQAFNLIKSMLEMNPDERPIVQYIVNSLFFPANRHQLFESVRSSFEKNWSIPDDNIVHFKKLLIDEDSIDVNVKFKSGYTLLHILCDSYKEENLIDLVRLLIAKGVKVNIKHRGKTPLHKLCANYRKENLKDILQLLIDNRAKVNITDKYGENPLYCLCENYENGNLIDIVQLLIEKGADVNAKGVIGMTPLHTLCQRNYNDNLIAIIELLIQKGAEVNAKNKFEMTPLHLLCIHYNKDNRMDIIQLLIQNGAEVNTKDEDGWTPLHSLCSNHLKDNLMDIVQLFIQKGANANAMDMTGDTPFLLLCRFYKIDNGSKEEDDLKSFIRLAEENGARMYAKDKDGTTPNNYLVQRKEKTMFAMESTSPSPSEAVGVPKEPIITKDEDASSVQQSITTTERPTTAKALPQEPLLGPSSDAHDGEFIRPDGTTRKRKKSNYPFANVRQNSEQFFNNAEPITAQLEPVESFIVPGTTSIIKSQLNQEPIAIQPLDTQYNGPINKVRRMEDPAYSQPVIDDSRPPPTGAS